MIVLMKPTIPSSIEVSNPRRATLENQASGFEHHSAGLDYLAVQSAIFAISGLTIAMASRGRAARVRQDLMDRGLANQKPKLPAEQIKKRKRKRKRKR